MNLTRKQVMIVDTILKGNPDGTWLDIDQLIENLPYETSKDSISSAGNSRSRSIGGWCVSSRDSQRSNSPGCRRTGMRLWTGAISSLASVVMMA